MNVRLISILLLTSATLLLNGCIASIGSSGTHRTSATLGQQLIDLQKAKEAGAISEQEYQAQRAKLLDKR